MDKFIIQGGNSLNGTIKISGAKNSVLPLMISALLTDSDIVLNNVPPYLSDVTTLIQLLKHLGVNVDNVSNVKLGANGQTSLQLTLNASSVKNFSAPHYIVKQMRASFWVLGPLLARFGQAKVALPGGCKIGSRKIDLHLDVLESMGAKIKLQNGHVIAHVHGRLKAIHFKFNKISVGATINAIMCACLAQGQSTFINCATEPEIVDLCHLLTEMGAEIRGIGTDQITITGKQILQGAHHEVIPDRIEAGTYMAAVGLTGGKLILQGINYNFMANICEKFFAAGLDIFVSNNSMTVVSNKVIKPVDIVTAPYPGFPTDMQAQFMVLMCIAHGTSIISENLFENRFMHVLELRKMGANIVLKGNQATVKGKTDFKNAKIIASDLRASVCLVLASLVAKGETIIENIHHIDRGYSQIEQKLTSCGANIIRANN